MSEKEDLLRQLVKLVSSMNVPTFRRESPFWLKKNMKQFNCSHKNYNKAMEICEKLLKMGVR